MKQHNISQVALMTGLTTRTLRNYINMGILQGRKEAGRWQFSEAEVTDMMEHPFVKEEMQIKDRAQVRDFLNRQASEQAAACMIYDLPGEEAELESCCKALVDLFNRCYAKAENQLSYNYDDKRQTGRFIFSGSPDMIGEMLAVLKKGN